MIEKILERLREKRDKWLDVWSDASITDDMEDCFYADGMSEAFMEAMKIVQEVAKEYGKDTNVPSSGWIPCSERLPEDSRNVLVTTRFGTIWSASHDRYEGTWVDDVTDALLDVIAWQPLPAPYQKGE